MSLIETEKSSKVKREEDFYVAEASTEENAEKEQPYKFFTGSGTWPLYKYLRYEILPTVGADKEQRRLLD
jgi:hypothetical protein